MSPRVRRYSLIGAAAVAGFAVVCAVILAITGKSAADSLNAAKDDLASAQQAAAAGDIATALTYVPSIAANAADARGSVDNPIWALAQHVPFISDTASTAVLSINAVDLAASRGVGPLMSARSAISGGGFFKDGAVNLDVLSELRTQVQDASSVLAQAHALAASAPSDGAAGSIGDQAKLLTGALQELNSKVAVIDTAVSVLPSMLGADSVQRYFVAFTSPAEARGTGGFLGSFGILKADRGRISFERLEQNTALKSFAKPVVELDKDYTAYYGDNSALWSGMNLSPHFPNAARQWIAGWKKRSGQRLQGAIQVDPATLAYLSEVSGPISLPDGRSLKADQVEAYLTNGVYVEFENDDASRKDFQVSIAEETFSAFLSAKAAPEQLAGALGRAASERRLLVYSTDPVLESKLAGWPIAGEVTTEPGPYVQLVLNNTAGNKADYYVDRSVTYETGVCASGVRQSTITAKLTNMMPAGHLPLIIDQRLDSNKATAKPRSTRLWVEFLLPMDARVKSASIDGVRSTFAAGAEAGRPAIRFDRELAAGAPQTISIVLEEPAGVGEATPEIVEQPLIRQLSTEIRDISC